MTRYRARSTLVAAAAALLFAVLPNPAGGDEPLMTDRQGDAGPLSPNCFTFVVDTCVANPLAPRAVDIVTGDMTTAGSTVHVSLGVVDLDDPVLQPDESIDYFMRVTGNVRLELKATRTRAGDPATGTLTATSGPTTVTETVPVALDHAFETVTWSASIQTLDGLRARVCPACDPIRRHTVLQGISAFTTLRRQFSAFVVSNMATDTASTTTTYTIGDR